MNQSNKRAYSQRPQVSRPAQRPAGASNRRPAAPASAPRHRAAPSGRRMPYGMIPLIIFSVVFIAMGFFLQCIWPNGFPVSAKEDPNAVAEAAKIAEIHSSGPVRINEVMASNSRTLSLQDGATPDWIEIANVSNKSVSIGGYSLSKSTNSASVFVFPDMKLDAGQCVLVYADSRLRESAEEDLHAPFRIGASGDTLMLFNSADTAVDTVNLPALGKDQAYVRISDTGWEISDRATPWMENSEESYLRLSRKAENSPVIVNEIMASNSSVKAGKAKLVLDYIELYNRSGEAVNLGGWYLSDDRTNIRKWAMPDVTIGAGEYLVIYASGQDQKVDPDMLHTSFALSSEGECAALANRYGQIMDLVEYDVLRTDQAYSLGADGSWTTSIKPTPGAANQ